MINEQNVAMIVPKICKIYMGHSMSALCHVRNADVSNLTSYYPWFLSLNPASDTCVEIVCFYSPLSQTRSLLCHI